MKSKLVIIFICVFVVSVFCITLASCNTDNNASIEKIEGATINEHEIFMWVDADTDMVSLPDKVKCTGKSVWKLYYDNIGQTEIPTKIAAGKNGRLQDGDNIFYIVVNSQDGTYTNTYQLTIHRSYAVNLYYCDGRAVLNTEKVLTGVEYTLNYVPNILGYTFNGWKNNLGESVTTITIWESTALYVDKAAISFTVSLDVNGGDKIQNSVVNLVYGETTTLVVPTREHYNFVGWFVGNVAITDNEGTLNNWNFAIPEVITAHWELKQFAVEAYKNYDDAGTITGGGTYDYGTNVTLTALTNNGYNFLGWYDSNDYLVTSNSSHTFNVSDNVAFTAKWNYFTVTTISNIETAGAITSYNDTKVSIGTEVTIAATTNIAYIWLGWYKDNELVSNELTYEFIMSNEDVIITAVWVFDERLDNFTYTLTIDSCKITGVLDKTVREIIIPEYVTSIDRGALGGCSSLETITVPFVYTCFGYIFGKSAYLGSVATQQGSSYDIYYLPKTLRYVTVLSGDIPNYAFYNCNLLEQIILPVNLTKIGNYAFYNCTGVSEFVLPQGLSYIGDYSFYNCSNVSNFVLPQSLIHIGNSAFTSCRSVVAITFEDPTNWYKSRYPSGADATPIDFSSNWNNVLILAAYTYAYATYYDKY